MLHYNTCGFEDNRCMSTVVKGIIYYIDPHRLINISTMYVIFHYHLIIAPPLPPNSPTVQPLNTTALNVSRSLPWPYSVNSYTLTISSPDISPQYNTTNDTYFIVSMETVHVSECSLIVLSVEANTDVGGSGNSNNTTTGFPKCKLSHCLIYRE